MYANASACGLKPTMYQDAYYYGMPDYTYLQAQFSEAVKSACMWVDVGVMSPTGACLSAWTYLCPQGELPYYM